LDTLPWRLFIVEHTWHVRYSPKADIASCTVYARIRGKADALITLPMPAFGRLERRLERVIDFAGRAAFHVRNAAGLEFADLILEFVR
jgi:hypothetical protein